MEPMVTLVLCLPAVLALIACACGAAVLWPSTAPEFAVHRHLRTRNPCIDGVSFPKRLKIHRHMLRMI
jgi:hypothetical protein